MIDILPSVARDIYRSLHVAGVSCGLAALIDRCYEINVKKTYQFKTHCKDDVMISLH